MDTTESGGGTGLGRGAPANDFKVVPANITASNVRRSAIFIYFSKRFGLLPGYLANLTTSPLVLTQSSVLPRDTEQTSLSSKTPGFTRVSMFELIIWVIALHEKPVRKWNVSALVPENRTLVQVDAYSANWRKPWC